VCSYEALVDGLRQGPSSFASLVYYSQLAYEFVPKDGRPRAVRFRLIPHRHDDDDDDDESGGGSESGMLDANQQDDVSTSARRHGDSRPVDYLRQEFIERLQRDEPVTYQLQIQINDSPHRPAVWNPQLVGYVQSFFSAGREEGDIRPRPSRQQNDKLMMYINCTVIVRPIHAYICKSLHEHEYQHTFILIFASAPGPRWGTPISPHAFLPPN